MACLAWPSRLLISPKLRQGGHKGVTWVREHARLALRKDDVASVHTRHTRRAASRRWEWGRGVCVCERVQEVLTRKQTLGAAAHLRWVIFVFLRTAASAEAPLTPMALCPRLQGMGAGACQRALTERRTHGGGGEPERSHGAPLEPLAQLGDALGGVGAVPILVDAAQRVTVQAAKKDEGGVSTGIDEHLRGRRT